MTSSAGKSWMVAFISGGRGLETWEPSIKYGGGRCWKSTMASSDMDLEMGVWVSG